MPATLAVCLIVAGLVAFCVNSRLSESRSRGWGVSVATLPLGLAMFLGICAAAALVYQAV